MSWGRPLGHPGAADKLLEANLRLGASGNPKSDGGAPVGRSITGGAGTRKTAGYTSWHAVSRLGKAHLWAGLG